MLDAPVMRAASLDMPYPFSTILEEYMVLNSAKSKQRCGNWRNSKKE